MIHLERAYDAVNGTDHPRFLVERLWPRGVKKTSLKLDGWFKDAAPSTDLRKWFNHEPAKWNEFRRRYFAELEKNPGAWQSLLDAAHRGTITLVYSSRDTEHNNAVALQEFLGRRLSKHTSKP